MKKKHTLLTDELILKAAMGAVIDAALTLPADQRQDYITAVGTVAISAMRGTYGPAFTRGFLAAALESMDDPVHIVLIDKEAPDATH